MQDKMTKHSWLASAPFRIALSILVVLFVPAIGMILSDDVNWTVGDFLSIGLLVLVAAVAYEYGIKRLYTSRGRVIAVIALLGLCLYIWAELAVGILTTLGS